MRFSIIVPIYKVENYIEECVSSVLSQSYKDFELILVDDGSPDNCHQICDSFAKNDERVKVIHKENGGLSDARNTGVKEVSGDYVLFLDGDDYWDDKDALLKLSQRAELTKADIINFSYKKVYENTRTVIPYFTVPDMPLELSFDKQIEYIIDNGLLIASACNKLIKRTLLNCIEFEKGVYSEDIVWCAALISKANSLDYICENFYCYRQRPRSITHLVNNKRCDDLKKAILDCLQCTEKAEGKIKDLLLSYTAFQFGTFILVQAQAQEFQKNNINCLVKYKKILKYHNGNKKLLCLNLATKIIGYKALCKVVRTIYKLFKR